MHGCIGWIAATVVLNTENHSLEWHIPTLKNMAKSYAISNQST